MEQQRFRSGNSGKIMPLASAVRTLSSCSHSVPAMSSGYYSNPAMISDFAPSCLSYVESGRAQMIGMAAARDGRNSKEVVIGDANKDPQWQWPTSEKWFARLEGKWKTRDTTDELQEGEEKRLREDILKCPFKVTTHIRELEEWVSITLRSPHLIDVLRECYDGLQVRNLCCGEPVVDAKDLFIAWPKLREKYEEIAHRAPSLRNWRIDLDVAAEAEEKPVEYYDPIDDGPHSYNVEGDDVCAAMHLHHLLRFLRHHFKDVSAKISWMTEKNVVSYDMLWAFLTPGAAVRWRCNISAQDCYGVVKSPGKYQNGFNINLEVMNFDVVSYRRYVMTYWMQEFDGEVPFTSLAVCPLSFFDTSEKQCLEERLTERGRKFYECAMKEPFRLWSSRDPWDTTWVAWEEASSSSERMAMGE